MPKPKINDFNSGPNKQRLKDLIPLKTIHHNAAHEELKTSKSTRTKFEKDDLPEPGKRIEIPSFEHRAPKKVEQGTTLSIVLGSTVFVLILIGAYFASSLFAQVIVKVTPKHQSITLNSNTFDAYRNPGAGQLGFQTMSTSASDSATISASSTVLKTIKATGTVRLFNTTKTAQKLIAGTRLESKAGKIYHIDKAVTLPTATTKGKVTTPGQVDVTITADAAGESYNATAADLTLPAYKGTTKYTAIYGRTTKAITGGFSGQVAVISDTDKAKAKAILEPKLKTRILAEAKKEIPPNFVLYDDAVIISYTDAVDQGKFTETVTLTGVLFNKDALATFLAANQIKDYDNGDVTASDLSKLTFKLNNKDALNPSTATQINFTLNGPADIIWGYSPEHLKADLYASTDGNYQSVFAKYPQITATIIFRPPWLRSLPTNQSKLLIQTNI